MFKDVEKNLILFYLLIKRCFMKKGFGGFIFFVIAFIVIRQFSGSSGEALKYNNKIVGYQNKIIVKIIDLSKSLDKFNADEMDRKLTALQDQIDESLAGVKAMDGFKGNYRFRDAAIKLIEFYKDMCENEYSEMIEILKQGPSNITQSDITYMQELQASIEKTEAPLDREMQSAQREFAAEYKFKITQNKYQKELDKLGK